VAGVLIYVEGRTEYAFVRETLTPHLEKHGVYLRKPVIAIGLAPYARVRREILALLRDSSVAAVTTMLDYYGLPRDFPGRDAPAGHDCYERVAHVEEQLRKDMEHPKFLPYLQLHEFEALLFAVPSQIAKALAEAPKKQELQRIRQQFGSPEEIDDDPATAPSKRIEAVFGCRYQKTLHGPQIAARIGLDSIRHECAHFDQWLTMLEGLASP